MSTALNSGAAFNKPAVLFVFTSENGINIQEFAISHLNFCIELFPRSDLLTFIQLNNSSKYSTNRKIHFESFSNNMPKDSSQTNYSHQLESLFN